MKRRRFPWNASLTLLLLYCPVVFVLLRLSLTETYHMIDTCDPEIACWSDDGETFVVKDPIKFEKTIIPQFFKHSKFSSFVRVRSHQACTGVAVTLAPNAVGFSLLWHIMW